MPILPEMKQAIKRVYRDLRALGVTCLREHTCCGSCGHAEAEERGLTNYIFYHAQDADLLREGAREVYLTHCIRNENIRVEVLEYIGRSDNLIWSGRDLDRMLISPDPALRQRYAESMRERERLSGSAMIVLPAERGAMMISMNKRVLATVSWHPSAMQTILENFEVL